MTLKLLLMTSMALTAFALPAYAQALSQESQNFVEKATVGNMFEIRSSEEALHKATRQDIRSFAKTMIDDHTKASKDLKSTISSANINVEPPQTLDDDHEDKIKNLQKMDAEDFDENYIEIQIDAHEKALSLFQDYAENGDNEALQQFAVQTLPVLRQHEERIKQIDKVD